MSKQGIVVRWSEKSGFGFVAQAPGEADIFVHRTALVECSRLNIGDLVGYDAEFDHAKDKWMALRVTILEQALGDNEGKRYLEHVPHIPSQSDVSTCAATPMSMATHSPTMPAHMDLLAHQPQPLVDPYLVHHHQQMAALTPEHHHYPVGTPLHQPQHMAALTPKHHHYAVGTPLAAPPVSAHHHLMHAQPNMIPPPPAPAPAMDIYGQYVDLHGYHQVPHHLPPQPHHYVAPPAPCETMPAHLLPPGLCETPTPMANAMRQQQQNLSLMAEFGAQTPQAAPAGHGTYINPLFDRADVIC